MRFPTAPRSRYRTLVFLCQDCHGELDRTAELFADDRVWRCLSCSALWIYTGFGWGRIASHRAQHMTVRGSG
jgi:hypothetical protein